MIFQKWTGKAHIKSQNYLLKSICDNFDGLTIVLVDEQNHGVQLNWCGQVERYACTTEEARFRFIANEWQKFREENGQYPVYRVQQSDEIKWIEEQSGGFIQGSDLQHFLIVTQDYIVDVVAYDEPIVTV